MVVLKNKVAILMMSAKLATLGLLKIKLFRNKGYDVTISVHDVINRILSYDQSLGTLAFFERSYHNLNFIRS